MQEYHFIPTGVVSGDENFWTYTYKLHTSAFQLITVCFNIPCALIKYNNQAPLESNNTTQGGYSFFVLVHMYTYSNAHFELFQTTSFPRKANYFTK